MSDETEESSSLGNIEVDTSSKAEWHEYSGAGSSNSGAIIFPEGVDVFAAEVGAIAIRIADKGGEIEILTELGRPWRQVDKASGALAAVPRKDK